MSNGIDIFPGSTIASAGTLLAADGSTEGATSQAQDFGSNGITTSVVAAPDSDGLGLYDDGGNGIFVKDGGNVGIGTTNPGSPLEVNGDIEITAG